MIKLNAPLPPRARPSARVRAGARVYLSGSVLTMRDMSLARLVSRPRTLNLKGAAIFFCAPTRGAKRPNKAVSCGPTTTARMAQGMPFLLSRGARIFIGKGPIPASLVRAMSSFGAVYLAAVGGCGAYYSRFLKKVRTAAFGDLGPEAVLELEVENMPLLAAVSDGRDIFAAKS